MLITQAGLDELKKALDERISDREKALIAVSNARGLGDISENAELDAAKIDLERCHTEITEMTEKISSATVFDSSSVEENKIGFSATVEIEDEDGIIFKYQLLGPCESDLSKNILSISSPMGQSMIGKMIGDSFKVQRPIGEKEYTVISIKYLDLDDDITSEKVSGSADKNLPFDSENQELSSDDESETNESEV